MPTPVTLMELMLLPPGEVLSVRTPGRPEHFGVLTGQRTIISASKAHGRVVEEWPADFSSGAQIYAHGTWSNQPWQETMKVARSQLGEPYRLFNNNCEHFVRFCHGLERKSPQLEAAVVVGLLFAAFCIFANALGGSGARPGVRMI